MLVKILILLEFTPLEFETCLCWHVFDVLDKLEFTPLEFETLFFNLRIIKIKIRIYSVGV